MKRKIKHTDDPVGNVKVVSDFLPSPEELALKDETIKGSIALGGDRVGFPEREERRNNPQHQRIIRRPLKEGVTHKAGRWLTPENAS